MALMVGVTCVTIFHFTCASAMANPQLKGTDFSSVRMRDCGAGILSQCLPPHVTKHLGYTFYEFYDGNFGWFGTLGYSMEV